METELNTTARDKMVHQISEAMTDITEKMNALKIAMNYLEEAQNSSYTEPMDKVKVVLAIASRNLDVAFHKDSKKAMRLAGVADQIYRGESNGN